MIDCVWRGGPHRHPQDLTGLQRVKAVDWLVSYENTED